MASVGIARFFAELQNPRAARCFILMKQWKEQLLRIHWGKEVAMILRGIVGMISSFGFVICIPHLAIDVTEGMCEHNKQFEEVE